MGKIFDNREDQNEDQDILIESESENKKDHKDEESGTKTRSQVHSKPLQYSYSKEIKNVGE